MRFICVYEVKIIKKSRVLTNGAFDRFFYGISIVGEEVEYQPLYPFTDSVNEQELKVLDEFVEEYYGELIEWVINDDGLPFANWLYGFETELKERFWNRWGKRGLVVY